VKDTRIAERLVLSRNGRSHRRHEPHAPPHDVVL
jgi:hypothetical protein